jgi:hypothetical protein
MPYGRAAPAIRGADLRSGRAGGASRRGIMPGAWNAIAAGHRDRADFWNPATGRRGCAVALKTPNRTEQDREPNRTRSPAQLSKIIRLFADSGPRAAGGPSIASPASRRSRPDKPRPDEAPDFGTALLAVGPRARSVPELLSSRFLLTRLPGGCAMTVERT